ncbi:hypothetical protein GBA52_008742 [Prunus armeniaca]|nr:hypothetical protein GBA52_008742 [Prunus armeniaca]
MQQYRLNMRHTEARIAMTTVNCHCQHACGGFSLCLLLLASVSCLQMLCLFCFLLLLQIFKSLLVFLFLPCRVLWVENATISARYETHTGPHRNDHRELPLSTCMRGTFSFSLHVETGLRENLNGLGRPTRASSDTRSSSILPPEASIRRGFATNPISGAGHADSTPGLLAAGDVDSTPPGTKTKGLLSAAMKKIAKFFKL